MKSMRLIPVSLAVLLFSTSAHATFNVSLDISQVADPITGLPVSWVEDVTPLVTLAADGSFSMLTGSASQAFLQNGNFSSTAPSIATHPDYWAWNATGNNWNWHSAETASGQVVTGSTPPTGDPWMSVVNLNNTVGHKAQDIDYNYTAKNNTAVTQTYTYSVVEDINPAIANPSSVFNQFQATFANASNNFLFSPTNASGAQQFFLSTDGINWTNAGVDVGGTYANPANGTSVTASATGVGPNGGPWKFMKLQTSFTLSGNKDSAAIVGLASISPVPEPETWMSLIAGFGLLGFMVRRRNNT